MRNKRNPIGLIKNNFSMNSYVNLSNNDKYPENSNSCFITQLSQPIQLNEESSVALVEINYFNDLSINLGKFLVDFERSNTNSHYQKEIDLILSDFKDVLTSIQKQYDSLISSIHYFKHYMNRTTDGEDDMLQSCQADIINDIKNLIKCLNDIKDILIDCSFHLEFNFIQVSSLIDSFKQTLGEPFKFYKFKMQIESLHLDHEINMYEKAVSEYLQKSKLEINFVLKNRFTFDDFYDFIISQPIFAKSEIIKSNNKVEFLFRLNFTVIADKLITNNIKCSFTSNKIVFEVNKYISPINNFYIYTNIITDEFKYSSFQPLLKIVNLEGKLNDYTHTTFENPHYRKVNKTFINSIEIQIKDSFNHLINFNQKTQLKLHFKNIKI